MATGGLTWFAGNFASWALYVHRGPLAQLILTYPAGRGSSRVVRAAVGAGYVYAVVSPVAGNAEATIAFALALAAVALHRRRVARGPLRQASNTALLSASLFASVLVAAAASDLAGADTSGLVLWLYEAAIAAVAVLLAGDLVGGRWGQRTLEGLVVDLGEANESGTLRDALARALGDPSLVIGYRLPGREGFVDDAGVSIGAADGAPDRAVTAVGTDAILVHDRAVPADRELVRSVAAAASIALANARLGAELRTRLTEVASSRRRIVAAADRERARLEEALRDGPERRLARAAASLAAANSPLGAELDAARAELREFARGVRPRTLGEHGLAAAVAELAARSPVPATVAVPEPRLPGELEIAVYFVCAEALANVAKHAHATSAAIRIELVGAGVRATVVDDGAGGADPSGSGLSGIADRVEALGGRLRLESPPGRGTTLEVTIPLV